MDINWIGLLIATAFFLLGIIVMVVALRHFDTSETDDRIQTFIRDQRDDLQSGGMTELQRRELTGSLLQRTIIAWFNAVIAFLGRFTPSQSVEETNRRLVIAGNPMNFRAQQFYGFRALLLIAGAVAAFSYYQIDHSNRSLLLSMVLMLAFLLAPELWLKNQMKRRQDEVRRGLPDVLDMLSVCVSAGLSFDQAIQRVGQTYRTPVGLEFARVISEIEIGISRKQALRNMQARVDIPELSSFVAVILQSELLGMSIADVLHAQADLMRVYRQYRAKELAQQLPAKMMIPLAIFIFPALLAVILGPMLPALQEMLR